MGIGFNLRGISGGGKEERWHMRPDRAAPQPEMVNAASGVLREGTILLADGYGPGEGGEHRGEGKRQACGDANLGHHRDAYILERDPFFWREIFDRKASLLHF